MGGVCCIATIVKFNDPDKIIENLGLTPGGNVHKFFMTRARERMLPYTPYRDYGTFTTELETNYEKGYFKWPMKYARKLYYGINSAAAQSGSGGFTFGNAINYTKRPHPKAGPFWDRNMMQAEGAALVREINAYIRSHGRG